MAGNLPEELDLLAYIEDELDAARKRDVAEHVRGCAACARQVRELETARDALRGAPALELPADRRGRVLAELPARARAPRPARRRMLALVAALLAVAALVAVVATQEGAPPIGGGGEDQAAEQAPSAGQDETAAEERADTAPEAAAAQAPLAEVQGPPARVADFLRERGYRAQVVDGAVEVETNRPAAVQRLLVKRFARGEVVVYVR